MKMAKASEADLNMALKLCSALEAIERRFFPEGSEGQNDPEDFEIDDDAQCGQVLRHLDGILRGGSIGRVIWGAVVMLDPRNKLVDPDADTIEHHPESVAAKQDTAALNWIERQSLDDFAIGFVGEVEEYWCSPESGGMYYGKTLRDALASAMAEGA